MSTTKFLHHRRSLVAILRVQFWSQSSGESLCDENKDNFVFHGILEGRGKNDVARHCTYKGQKCRADLLNVKTTPSLSLLVVDKLHEITGVWNENQQFLRVFLEIFLPLISCIRSKQRRQSRQWSAGAKKAECGNLKNFLLSRFYVKSKCFANC